MPEIYSAITGRSERQEEDRLRSNRLNALVAGKKIANALLNILPGSGEAISARESIELGNKMAESFSKGNYDESLNYLANSITAGVGAIPLMGTSKRFGENIYRSVKNKILDDIRKAKEKFGEDVPVGIRVFHPDENPKTGDYLPESFNWEDERIIIDEPLEGTAVFGVTGKSDDPVLDEALSYNVGGSKIGIVIGEDYLPHSMPEYGSQLLENARLFSIHERPDFESTLTGLRRQLSE